MYLIICNKLFIIFFFEYSEVFRHFWQIDSILELEMYSGSKHMTLQVSLIWRHVFTYWYLIVEGHAGVVVFFAMMKRNFGNKYIYMFFQCLYIVVFLACESLVYLSLGSHVPPTLNRRQIIVGLNIAFNKNKILEIFYEIRYVKFDFSSFINNITIVTLSLTNRFYLPNHRYSLILPPFKIPIFFILISV